MPQAKDEDHAAAVAAHFNAAGVTQMVIDYVERGREFLERTDAELLQLFKDSFRICAQEPWNRDRLRLTDEAHAEYVLRGQEPPYHLVREDNERIEAYFRGLIANMTPEWEAQINAAMVAAYEADKKNAI